MQKRRSGKTQEDVHQVLANTTYDVRSRTRKGNVFRKIKDLMKLFSQEEQGLLEDGDDKIENQRSSASGQSTELYLPNVIGSAISDK